MNAIVEEFERLWRDDPARPLIHLPSTSSTLTADDLQRARRIHRTAFERGGIGRGDVVLSVAGNRAGFFALLLAAWSLDAVVMPVDTDARDHDIQELAQRFGVAAIVRPRTRQAAGVTDLDDALTLEVTAHVDRRQYADIGLLKLTSGSSGSPKAVAVPPAAMIEDTAHITESMGIRRADTQLAVIPLSHAYGFGNLVLPLLLRGTAIVLREAFVPQMVMADARAYGARVLPGVPYMFQHFAAQPSPDGWPPSLGWLISAGARLEPAVVRACHERFGVKVHSFYGTSETGGIAFDGSTSVDDAPSVGWPMPGVTIDLCADDAVPEGYGRVLVRSSAVAAGYVTGAADEEPFGGQFLTGDYGVFEPDGRLLLAGRVSTFINVAGRKVQPAEVEHELRLMPGISDARVLAVADPVRGEQVAAVVAGSSTLTRGAIRQLCAERLPPYKVPRVIVVVPTLPLTERGKPDMRAMQTLVNEGLTRFAADPML